MQRPPAAARALAALVLLHKTTLQEDWTCCARLWLVDGLLWLERL
jgi:hypothetical protein